MKRRAGIAWLTGLVVVMTALVGTVGTNAAQAEDPAPSPSADTSPAQPQDTTGASPTISPETSGPAAPDSSSTGTATPSVTPTTTPPPCTNCPPDDYVPPDKTWFNHPFERSSASTIRVMVRRTVNSVPSGGSIKLAEFSLNDDRLVDALIAAWRRGVVVQVVVNNHNVTGSIPRLGKSQSFIRLSRVLGTQRYGKPGGVERSSFARYCHSSCRGRGGNVHYKLFLFSSVGPGTYDPVTGQELDPTLPVACVPAPGVTCGKRYVTMMGSPNLTTKAAYGQWNHLDTYSNQATYDYYSGDWFAEMRADRPVRGNPYERRRTGSVDSWTFPKPGTYAGNDPIMQALNGVRCKGATGGTGVGGRTKIRIGAYTFYENRGRYLSKKVRSLWNAGCDIAIEYAIMGDTVKRTLYSASGRGRIPMRQVVTFYRNGDLNAYDHAKYIAISGNYGGDSSTWITYTGTTNISDLGFRSDDTQQVWRSESRTRAYLNDFYKIWRERQARVPSPFSRLGARIGSPRLTLGQGRYAALEPN